MTNEMRVRTSMIGDLQSKQVPVLDTRHICYDYSHGWFLIEDSVDGIIQERWVQLPLDGAMKKEGNRLFWAEG